MINRREIEQAIAELESQTMTYATCERLAWLYTVRDHLADKMPNTQGSDFLEACAGVEVRRVVAVLDEHMECIRVTYPKEYTAIIQRLRDAK